MEFFPNSKQHTRIGKQCTLFPFSFFLLVFVTIIFNKRSFQTACIYFVFVRHFEYGWASTQTADDKIWVGGEGGRGARFKPSSIIIFFFFECVLLNRYKTQSCIWLSCVSGKVFAVVLIAIINIEPNFYWYTVHRPLHKLNLLTTQVNMTVNVVYDSTDWNTFVSYLYDSKAWVGWLKYICLLFVWQ